MDHHGNAEGGLRKWELLNAEFGMRKAEKKNSASGAWKDEVTGCGFGDVDPLLYVKNCKLNI